MDLILPYFVYSPNDTESAEILFVFDFESGEWQDGTQFIDGLKHAGKLGETVRALVVCTSKGFCTAWHTGDDQFVYGANKWVPPFFVSAKGEVKEIPYAQAAINAARLLGFVISPAYY